MSCAIDQPDASLAFRISLHFEPAVPKFERPARSGADVHELPRMPLTHTSLGDLAARCEGGCDERALRYGVLIAAGRLGAPDVVGRALFSFGRRQRVRRHAGRARARRIAHSLCQSKRMGTAIAASRLKRTGH